MSGDLPAAAGGGGSRNAYAYIDLTGVVTEVGTDVGCLYCTVAIDSTE